VNGVREEGVAGGEGEREEERYNSGVAPTPA